MDSTRRHVYESRRITHKGPYVYTILGRLRWISTESVIRETLEAYSFFKCKLINTVPESGLGNCLIIKWVFSSRQNLSLNKA